ncbi:MAG TPA: hypothetical protein VIL20_25705 [Sandaracinaceae bacterium]
MAYRITDEPEKSRLAHLTVRPTMVLLSLMLGGAWIAYPWFALNGFAMGSPTRRREAALCALGFVGALVLVLGLGALLTFTPVPREAAKYLALVVVVFKLGIGYRVTMLQDRTFPIYEHFGGTVRNALPILGAAFLGRLAILELLPGFWALVLG